jgi:predicted RNase H-like nuclease (RuvC/YqgF family)
MRNARNISANSLMNLYESKVKQLHEANEAAIMLANTPVDRGVHESIVEDLLEANETILRLTETTKELKDLVEARTRTHQELEERMESGKTPKPKLRSKRKYKSKQPLASSLDSSGFELESDQHQRLPSFAVKS